MPKTTLRRMALAAVTGIGLMPVQGLYAASVDVQVIYLRQQVVPAPVLSNLDPVPEDLGIAGANLALAEVAATGKFLGETYALTVIDVPPDGDFAAATREALAGAGLVLVDATAAELLAVADTPEAADKLLFNVASGDEALRSADCRANLLHTIPEDGARTDALMQVLAAKRWSKLALITGPKAADLVYADHLRRSAAKFGLTLVGEKAWSFDTDLRRAATVELPPFTQDLPDHDVLLVADETDDFGRYVENNTWLPRPVAGSEGMEPLGWTHVMEQWGAVQLQNRFEETAGRDMQSRDYAAWAAIRAIGEAVIRTGSADPATLRSYMLSDTFKLDGFKGRGLSFRHWNGQMRQPIAVANARALVTLAPVEGFLHQRNETDTLGLDEPESQCHAFTE
ncbi:branched-chain amino acid ABC transporter substrate-binding protein [Gemmobacter lutimaris]|uniref:Branched-chain amino acid ABC transporter substrate-binding protein n=1 Tax=Gemmobacter lutimaris TaxID=2306023 RepID=A0A398BNP8_9RHOB|nr:ABC transporter substrate-binding protein [Gemmobacter lutimaris]RID92349.1 branched-chain amino acid ABC transporter substrate-binding protein [Gemmobacter lutimaris]